MLALNFFSTSLAWGLSAPRLQLFKCLSWTQTWKGPRLVGTQVSRHGRRKEIRNRGRRSQMCKCFYCSLGRFSLQPFGCDFSPSALITFYKLIVVYIVNVEHGRLVNVEATEGVCLPFNMPHVITEENPYCGIVDIIASPRIKINAQPLS